MKTLILSLSLAFSSFVFANENTLSFENWNASAQEKERVFALLKNVGERLTYIWGDTILEGGYSLLDDRVMIENIEVVFKDENVTSFNATVSMHALYSDADECDWEFYEEYGEWNEECLENNFGRIYENFSIDPAGNRLETDDYAEFDI